MSQTHYSPRSISGKQRFPIKTEIWDKRHTVNMLVICALIGVVLLFIGGIHRNPRGEFSDVTLLGLAFLGTPAFLAFLMFFVLKKGELVLDDRGFSITIRNLLGIGSSSRTDFTDIESIVYYQVNSDMPSDPISREDFLQSTPESMQLRFAVLLTRSGNDVTLGGTTYALEDLKEIVTILNDHHEAAPVSAPQTTAEASGDYSAGAKMRLAFELSKRISIPLWLAWAIMVGMLTSTGVSARDTINVFSVGLSIILAFSGILVAFNWQFYKNLRRSMIDWRELWGSLAMHAAFMAAPFVIIGIYMFFDPPRPRPAPVPPLPQDELFTALYRDNDSVALALLDQGVPANAVDRYGVAPLLMVYYYPSVLETRVIRKLIEKGADVNAKGLKGETPLVLAVNKQNLEIATLLLKSGALPNSGELAGKRPLTLAIEKGNEELVKLLLQHKADVNYLESSTSCNCLQLQVAIERHQVELVPLLLKAGADPNRMDACGYTALTTAVERGDVDSLRLLLKKGANANITLPGRKTALMMAAEAGSAPAVALLVQAGAEIDRTDEWGRTALMEAARNGRGKVVKDLIKAGARTDIKSDKNGDTALRLAEAGNHQEATEILRAAGANE